MEIKPTSGVKIDSTEIARVYIDSDSDHYPPEEDSYLLMKIKEFQENNHHLSIEVKKFYGPDDEGYENTAVLYVSYSGWYARALRLDTRVKYKGVEYLSFGIWGTATDKPVIRLIDPDTKNIVDIPVREFNS